MRVSGQKGTAQRFWFVQRGGGRRVLPAIQEDRE